MIFSGHPALKHAPGLISATELGKFDFSYPQACVLTGVVLRTLKQSLWELCEDEFKIKILNLRFWNLNFEIEILNLKISNLNFKFWILDFKICLGTSAWARARARAWATGQPNRSENRIFPTLRLVCSPVWFWEPLSRACGKNIF